MTSSSKLQFQVNSQNIMMNTSYGTATLELENVIKTHGGNGEGEGQNWKEKEKRRGSEAKRKGGRGSRELL